MRSTRLLLVGLLWVAGSAAAQVSPQRVIVHKKLPDDLQSSFEGRISEFLTAQAEGRWEQVGEMLGRCQWGCIGGRVYKPYTESYKRCLVERMQEVRMVDFDFSIQDLSTSVPYGGWEPIGGLVDRFTAEQSRWQLKGTGRFQSSSESWTEQTELIAYRDQGQWYFVPPQGRMQDKWEKVHYTKADFAKDRRAEVDVRNNPSSPVEITDVHVYMEREYPSRRQMAFKLQNKTSKKIDAVGVSISGYLGPIQPRGQISGETEEFLAYDDFCDGMLKQEVFVEDVHFSDGSRWVFNKEWLPAGP
jgi:hypothetical protein